MARLFSKYETLENSLPLFHAIDVTPGHSALCLEETFSFSARDPREKRVLQATIETS